MPIRRRVPNPAHRPVFETLEARVLYSADFAPLEPAAVVPAAEARMLDASGEFAGDWRLTAQHQRREIVFVDAAASPALLQGLARDGSHGRTLEVIPVSHDRDGIAQVSEALSVRRELSAVHILTHGTDGVVRLGAGRLDLDSLLEHASRIRGWSGSLAADADLLIYGCDVAQGSAGASLVQALARLTGADVAASTDRTARAAQGGDWDLEYRTGPIETRQALDDHAAAGWTGALLIPPTVLAPPALSAQEDVPAAIAGVSVSDPEGDLTAVALGAANGSLSVDLSGGANLGAGANQSPSMTLTGSEAQINAALATLVYQGAADVSGADAVTILAMDAGGFNQSATVAVTLGAVNDAPSVTGPATRATSMNTQVVFRPGEVRIADVDAGAAALQVTITAANGVVSLGGTAGLTFTVGDGRSDSTMTFSGTLANINATLNNLRFVPAPDFTGLAQMSLAVDDGGSSGGGGAKIGAATVLIPVGEDDQDEIALTTSVDVMPSAQPGVPPVLLSLDRTGDSGTASAVAAALVPGRSILAAGLVLSAGGPGSTLDLAAAGQSESGADALATPGGWPMRVATHWLHSLVSASASSSRNHAPAQDGGVPPAQQPVVNFPELAAVPGLSSGALADPQRGTTQTGDEDVARLEQALTYVLGAAVSAGAVVWANRSLGLLAPVVMSMPAWKGIDPLPAVAPEDLAEEPPADNRAVLERAAESMVFRSTRGGGESA
jgi:hypothetical protein